MYIEISPAPCVCVAGMSEVLLSLPVAVAGLRIVSPGNLKILQCRQWLLIGFHCSRTIHCLEFDGDQCCTQRW